MSRSPLASLARLAPGAALALALAAAPAPALAQQDGPDAPAEPGKPLHEELLDQFLKEEQELNAKARAAVEAMLKAIAPIMEQFSTLWADLPAYEAPEILPNGDIIIRRKRKSEEPALDPEEPIKT